MSFKERTKKYLKDQEQLIFKQKEKYWNDLILPGLERLKDLKVLTLMEQYNKEVWDNTGRISTKPKTIENIQLNENGKCISLPEYRLSRKKEYCKYYHTFSANNASPGGLKVSEHHDYANNIDYISIVIDEQHEQITLTSENNPYKKREFFTEAYQNLVIININNSIPSQKITEQIEEHFIKNNIVQQKINQEIKDFNEKDYIKYTPY